MKTRRKRILEKSEEIFREATSKSNLKVNVESLKNGAIPAVLLLSEESRRFREMAKTFGRNFNPDMFPNEETLVLNLNNPLITSIIRLYGDDNRKKDAILAASFIYDLAVLNQRQLDPDNMVKFIEKCNDILCRFTDAKESCGKTGNPEPEAKQ